MLKHLYPAIAFTLVFALLTGIVFPLTITGLAALLFPWQAKGSFVSGANNQIVGSALIAQEFKSPRYFHSRPSAAGAGYNPTASGGTNLGPTSDKLINGTKDHSFIGIKELVGIYRQENGLAATDPVPVDAVTRSGSGLDADISLQNAQLQQLMTESRAQGDLHSCMVEQAIIASKTQSDQLTRQLNFEQDLQTNYSAKSITPAGTSAGFSALLP